MTVYWAPFLHVYQPPWQDPEVLKKIYQECYKPLLSMFERHKNVKITLNIQGCLLEELTKMNLKKAHTTAKNLIKEGKVELVGSGKFHPILPLIPPEEISRQIKNNQSTIEKFFPNVHIKGFFPPEMAVSNQILEIVKKLNYSWIIVDGIANADQWSFQNIQQTSSGLNLIFRDTFLSNKISFNAMSAQEFVEHLKKMYNGAQNQDYYVVTAQDAETFGHHIPFYETSFLGKVFSLIEEDPLIEVCFISDLVDKFPKKQISSINPSSWSTSIEDIRADIPYPLWQHPLNPIHKYQYRMLHGLYKLMELLEQINQQNGENSSFQRYYQTSRHFYDRALHSCWLWWGAGVQKHHGFWSPNLVYKGIDLVVQTGLNAQLALINVKIGRGEEFYSRIVDNSEKLMNELIEQEARGQQLRTYGFIS